MCNEVEHVCGKAALRCCDLLACTAPSSFPSTVSILQFSTTISVCPTANLQITGCQVIFKSTIMLYCCFQIPAEGTAPTAPMCNYT